MVFIELFWTFITSVTLAKLYFCYSLYESEKKTYIDLNQFLCHMIIRIIHCKSPHVRGGFIFADFTDRYVSTKRTTRDCFEEEHFCMVYFSLSYMPTNTNLTHYQTAGDT